MVAHFRRRSAPFGRFGGGAPIALALGGAIALAGCDKLPLLAPSGSVITLFATSNVLGANGSVEIVATVIEQGATSGGTGAGTTTAGAGTPVHNGTLVTFTTTIGSIDPREARTHNGQVNVRLTGDGRSGVAKVTAFSGGASGTIELTVGTAAAKTVVLTATPQNLGPSGGSSKISALVQDESGNGLGAVPVTFTTTAGVVQPSTATTDDTGVATTTLTTPTAADVTATVGSITGTAKVTLAARTGISITPPATLQAGQPGSFTVGVSSSANVTNVTVGWGDGGSTSLGAISGSTTVSHTYINDGAYTVTATATDSAGNRESVSTVTTVLAPPPVQVTLQASSLQPVKGQIVTFTATTGTLPAGAVISHYNWDFGDTVTAPNLTSNTTTHIYTTTGPKDIKVTVVLSNGSTGQGLTSITVSDSPLPTVALSANPFNPTTSAPVTFTATVGALPFGVTISGYTWAFGEGGPPTSGTNPTIQYLYTSLGTKTAQVTVVLSDGRTASAQAIVIVS